MAHEYSVAIHNYISEKFAVAEEKKKKEDVEKLAKNVNAGVKAYNA